MSFNPDSQWCTVCGSNAHRTKECPESFCNYCKEQGHFIKHCPRLSPCGNCGKKGHRTENCRNPTAPFHSQQSGSGFVPWTEQTAAKYPIQPIATRSVPVLKTTVDAGTVPSKPEDVAKGDERCAWPLRRCKAFPMTLVTREMLASISFYVQTLQAANRAGEGDRQNQMERGMKMLIALGLIDSC
ncbi:hypothetical protein T310_3207 [Rasamsonia emersonii CBS 393.64]|uniref:CCHC-type domain-containing protein n=1 Tax=Rasamsonia emersonii (strain ATCC 16479 / CBS 393.64 / IMI 116815) TaxID=1408163 RepID=A0A0F4YXE4_RASE3|nr:hypothetical protein T310_3207 [Rasamsonia emersonii CBS 393.64]KKA22750.1 hypothetical protein T310_3207 [Rasamsonia emersonii CBS 393.64]